MLNKNLKEKFVKDIPEIDIIDISYRGGTCGFNASTAINYINGFIDNNDLNKTDYLLHEDIPPKIGVYCNYLGGGIRGGLCRSDYNNNIDENLKELLELLIDKAEDYYNLTEDENGLLEDEDEDGNVNWDNIATKKARKTGITSAY